MLNITLHLKWGWSRSLTVFFAVGRAHTEKEVKLYNVMVKDAKVPGVLPLVLTHLEALKQHAKKDVHITTKESIHIGNYEL